MFIYFFPFHAVRHHQGVLGEVTGRNEHTSKKKRLVVLDHVKPTEDGSVPVEQCSSGSSERKDFSHEAKLGNEH